jgi:hypothetical protein
LQPIFGNTTLVTHTTRGIVIKATGNKAVSSSSGESDPRWS